jgi:hypothetical protein
MQIHQLCLSPGDSTVVIINFKQIDIESWNHKELKH